MTKSAPSAITLPSLAELQAGKPVLASTWAEIVAAQHYIYGRQGAHILNAVFDPPWQSLDYAAGGNAYHQTGAASPTLYGTIKLDKHAAIFRFTRTLYNTSAAAQGYNLMMQVYARNLNVRATVVRLDTADGNTGSVTGFTSLVTSHASGNSEWAVDSEEYTRANASRGGTYTTDANLAYFLVYLEALVPASGTGYLHQVALRETPITAAGSLPRGA